MAQYLKVTGTIRSRDCYHEEHWNPHKKQLEQNSLYTLRVEYTVDGKIYTHNFICNNGRGQKGDSYEVWYQKDNPAIVKAAVKANSYSGKKGNILLQLIRNIFLNSITL